MNVFTVTLLLTAASTGLSAQTAFAKVSGRVLRSDNGTNAGGVNVLLFSTTVKTASGPEIRTTKADPSGRYEFPQVTPGDYVLCVNGRGYADSCRWRQPENIRMDRGDVSRDLLIDLGVRIELVFVDDELLLEKAQEQRATAGLLEVGLVRTSGLMAFGIMERKKGVWVLRETAPLAAHEVRISSLLLRLADHRGNDLPETSQRTVSPLPVVRQLMFDAPAGTIRLKFRVAGLTPAGSARIR
jgi:hypothetical protein